MKIVDHPYLAGVRCREDGAVFLPKSGVHKARWTFGSLHRSGYRVAIISRKQCYVHRLICEAFHGTCPPDRPEVDHLDRNPSNNKPENLRWCTRSENMRNRAVNEESLARYGVSPTDDYNAYKRARYANDPEYREKVLGKQRGRWRSDPVHREKQKARNRERYANDPMYREKQKARSRGWYSKKKEAEHEA